MRPSPERRQGVRASEAKPEEEEGFGTLDGLVPDAFDGVGVVDAEGMEGAQAHALAALLEALLRARRRVCGGQQRIQSQSQRIIGWGQSVQSGRRQRSSRGTEKGAQGWGPSSAI